MSPPEREGAPAEGRALPGEDQPSSVFLWVLNFPDVVNGEVARERLNETGPDQHRRPQRWVDPPSAGWRWTVSGKRGQPGPPTLKSGRAAQDTGQSGHAGVQCGSKQVP